MNRKLRFGMVGGGRGAFIGAVHRIAAQMDGHAELVAGAFSSDAQRSAESGADLRLDPARVYPSYQAMVQQEAGLPAERRLDFVSIVTPNHEHFGPAKLFLEAGFNVICDKPVTLNVGEAEALRDIVRRTGKVFALTHNYSGNAMIKQARELVRSGELGRVRKVLVEYSQGWLATRLEDTRQKQAEWRTDPQRSGIAGCMADIGTHAEHLVRYVTDLRVASLCADLTTFIEGRALDDDGNVLIHYHGGARGVLHASQICVGEQNNLNLRVYGTKASLEWHQEHPNELVVKFPDRARQTWRRGESYVGAAAKDVTRVPGGHPEGYLEAFGNLYREAFRAIAAEVNGRPLPTDVDFPTIEDGLKGLEFVTAVVESGRHGGKRVAVPDWYLPRAAANF